MILNSGRIVWSFDYIELKKRSEQYMFGAFNCSNVAKFTFRQVTPRRYRQPLG